MVEVITQKYPGFVVICEGCGRLLAYKREDMYEGKFVYCPICKYKNEVRPIVGGIENDN